MRREVSSKPATLRACDLGLDIATREVRRTGQAIDLTTKEFAILQRSPNRVVARTQIAEHVRDHDFQTMSNIVDVYVGVSPAEARRRSSAPAAPYRPRHTLPTEDYLAVLGRVWTLGRTIRFRLTLWYVALLAVILCIFCTFLYLNLARSLQAELDRSLASTADGVLANLDEANGNFHLDDAYDLVSTGTMVVIYDSSSQVLLNGNPHQPPLPLLPDALSAIPDGRAVYGYVDLPGGGRWRAYAVPLDDGGGGAILEVARSEDDVSLALRKLVLLMGIAIPATLLLASAGGLFLAQPGARPHRSNHPDGGTVER